MEARPLGHKIAKAISWLFAPITRSYSWWLGFRTRSGSSFFVLPDAMAVLMVLFAPLTLYPPIIFKYPLQLLAAALLGPLAFFSLLRVRGGEVAHFRLFLLLPYWRTRVPQGSNFELYEAWEDDRPSGVAFSLPPMSGEYLHLGTWSNAESLFASIGVVLRDQGWKPHPEWNWLLTR